MGEKHRWERNISDGRKTWMGKKYVRWKKNTLDGRKLLEEVHIGRGMCDNQGTEAQQVLSMKL